LKKKSQGIPCREIVHFSKKKRSVYPQNYILPGLTGANRSTKTPATGHFETAGEEKMKKIMTVIRRMVERINEGQYQRRQLV